MFCWRSFLEGEGRRRRAGRWRGRIGRREGFTRGREGGGGGWWEGVARGGRRGSYCGQGVCSLPTVEARLYRVKESKWAAVRLATQTNCW